MAPLKHSDGLFSSSAGVGRVRLFSQFRTKLFLLALLLVVPALGLVFHSNFQQRRIEKDRARESAVAISRLGANAYVVKPTDFQQVLEAIKQLGLFWAELNEPPITIRRKA